ncbi:MAG: hypothetical protein FWD57_06385 [Polyangiaceae bacterium]|nr:hypothetical protein [Polyangiaceae bacterium]
MKQPNRSGSWPKNKPTFLSIPKDASRLPMDASLTGCKEQETAFSTERCIPNGMLGEWRRYFVPGDASIRVNLTLTRTESSSGLALTPMR